MSFSDFIDDFDNVINNWKKLAPSLLDFNYTLSKSQHEEVSQKLLEHYLGENEISKEKLIKMFSDRVWIIDAEASTKLQAKATKSPVYYYLFTYLGDFNHFKRKTILRNCRRFI